VVMKLMEKPAELSDARCYTNPYFRDLFCPYPLPHDLDTVNFDSDFVTKFQANNFHCKFSKPPIVETKDCRLAAYPDTFSSNHCQN
jgi:hypothetical protein